MIFKEFSLEPDHPFIACLDKMLKWVRSSDVPNNVVGEPQSDLSEEYLQRRINDEIPNKCCMSRFDHHTDFDFSDIQKGSTKMYEQQTGIKNYALIPVAKTWYPNDGGYIGWHTDESGGRLYSSWADGESFFRYRDPESKKIITSYDKPNQWSFRAFTFDENNPLWHCVYAKDTRISIGYRFIHT